MRGAVKFIRQELQSNQNQSNYAFFQSNLPPFSNYNYWTLTTLEKVFKY